MRFFERQVQFLISYSNQPLYNFNHSECYGNEQYVYGKLYNKVEPDQSQNNKGKCAGITARNRPFIEQIVVEYSKSQAENTRVYYRAGNCREDNGKVCFCLYVVCLYKHVFLKSSACFLHVGIKTKIFNRINIVKITVLLKQLMDSMQSLSN